MKKVVKIIFYATLGIFILIQFIRLDKNQGGYESLLVFESETNVPEQVKEILKTNCYDCHSNQTVYPWYAEIAPVSFWMADHVNEGKDELNFSEWKSFSTKRKDHKLEELVEELEKGEMPLDSYTWTHGKLSEKDQELLIQWANIARLPYQMELRSLQK